ncbi:MULTISPECIES: alpha/beta hydrolase family protein [unclassified Paenibacillus]|uniref:alpha/beta hydrolase family protein n=1 Tax=unclassified Paenibacillus TaxID=185978 RepID=UPI0003FC1B51|nr:MULTISPECIES: alpha/beta fold hydrolase [unclassified Paenibacillus]KGP80272.1 alpha/beta hydrolase [Paenibacillus sp. MAEPY1]KGP80278.1 alpha/beta hydrolase [Paenibacillus sp. MAEPY2]
MKLIFDDQTFSFELLRTMGYAAFGGADVGECLSTAYRIEEGNFESWYEEWLKTGIRAHREAEESSKQGNKISAREFYLRASNYYRTAEFFLHGNPEDKRILETWSLSRNTFRQALSLLDHHWEIVSIPYEDTELPGYFYLAGNQPGPVLIVHGGYDSTAEELYFQVVTSALERGYHCLVFEGPGQGAVIREQRIPFRHDWEAAVTPVVDYLTKRPEVISDKMALMGISLGGYLAPRAAAYEHRLAACIANDGLFSFQVGAMAEALGINTSDKSDLSSPETENLIASIMAKDTGTRWGIENGQFTFLATNVEELVRKTEPFTLDGVAEQIMCPVLVCEAEHDHAFAGQPERLFQSLKSSKTYMKFTAEDSAEEHCHFGALKLTNHRMFTWLDQVLNKN